MDVLNKWGEEMSKVVQVDGLIHMFKDMRARLNPRDYHSLLEYDTRDTMLLNMVQMLQLSDGIELVFCKDCKHWYPDADCGMACEFTNMSQPEDGFCNWGVAKESE